MNKKLSNLTAILAATAIASGCSTYGRVDPVRDIGFLGQQQQEMILDSCKQEEILKPYLEEGLPKKQAVENCVNTHNNYVQDGTYMMGQLIEFNYNNGTLGSGIPTPSHYFAPTTTPLQREEIAKTIFTDMVSNQGGQDLFMGYVTKAAEEGARIARKEMQNHFIVKDLVATAILTSIYSTNNVSKATSTTPQEPTQGSFGTGNSSGNMNNIFN